MTPPTVAVLDGRLVPWGEARLPLDDRGLLFGESLYEVLPVTRGEARLVEAHAARMRAGAAELGLAEGVPGDPAWDVLARELIAAERLREGLLYAQLTGGSAPRAHLPVSPPRPVFFAYLTPHRFPRAADAARGLRAALLPDPRWARSDLKTTMLLPAVLAKGEARRRGAGEALLVGADGHLHEGGSSNLFVLRGRRLSSPIQRPHLLPGITRELVAAEATDLNLEVVRTTVTVVDLEAADEAFVTATSLGVMPLVAVDDRPVGAGAAGPVATELARRLCIALDLDD